MEDEKRWAAHRLPIQPKSASRKQHQLEDDSMIGILFFGAIAIWAWVALALGSKLPRWLGITRYRTAFGFVFALLVFVTPVADEIIAYPQLKALCSDLPSLDFAEGMNEQKAFGRTVYYRDMYTSISVFPSSVRVDRHDGIYFDARTNEPVLAYHGYTPRKAFLSVPNGSSGGFMTLILRGCSGMKSGADGYVIEKFDSTRLPVRFSNLKLTNTR
ncbi:hypothetical protein [Curvibacter fontanus]